MFLSQLYLNPQCPDVRRDLGDVYELHRTINSAFPDLKSETGKSARETFNVLYRSEFKLNQNKILILLQSEEEPKWQNISVKYPEYLKEPPKVKQISFIMKGLENGQMFRFKLKANPTKRLMDNKNKEKQSNKKKENGPRIPLKSEDDLMKWIIRKGEQGGFKPVQLKMTQESPVFDFVIIPEGTTQGLNPSSFGTSQKGKRKEQSLTFHGVVFEGNLVVTDLEKFKVSLQKGIGSGKAFGYGLLSIAPIQ